MRTLLPIVCAALLLAAVAQAQSKRSTPKPPAGTKVVSGRHFDMYVSKKSEKPMGVEGFTLITYGVVAVAKTKTHGTQRVSDRFQVINVDLLNAANWEVTDLDRDGFDDFRYVGEIGTNGCHTWEARRWEPLHDRFSLAPKFIKWSDKQGKVLTKSCAGLK